LSGGEPGLLVNIDVDDLARAIDFYAAAFDLTVKRRFGAEGVELAGAAVAIFLLHKPAGSMAVPGEPRRRRNYARHWTPVHLDFTVADIHVAMDRALRAGANLDRPLQSHSWGHVAMMSDPFGNGFCLLEFVGRGYDEIADATTT
jgi:predicted enzyme related to lactoylglutathione lyase